MYRRLTALVLHWLRVPPEPHPPLGDPASLRVFRAGHNFFKLRLARWGLAQLLALAGIVFWVGVFLDLESGVHARHQTQSAPVSPKEVRNFDEFIEKIGADPKADPTPTGPAATPERKRAPRHRINGWAGFRRMMVEVALRLPPWGFPLLWTFKIAGILAYLVQLPVTYLIARLDFEMRWYMVTDRSLRIRHGVWRVNESTMSFANIQQVEVSQGPLQRLLGLADVKVQSAGGGASEKEHHHSDDDMHRGQFHSVTNAPEIRDLILERLRRFRAAGLGDPDDHRDGAHLPTVTLSAVPTAPAANETLAAARALLEETRALRRALES